jgi:hypothetical protein
MSDDQEINTTSQALARCDELAIALRRCADAEKKYEHDALSRLSAAGIAVGGIGSFITLTATGLVATTFATAMPGLIVGGLLLLGFLGSIVVGIVRDEKLGNAQTTARAHIAEIKNAMLDDYRHLLKTVAEAAASAPPSAAVPDVTAEQPAVPARTGTVAQQVPIADPQPVRPATASQTQSAPVLA